MKVLYHNDLDGKCSASLIHYFYERLDDGTDEIFSADKIEYFSLDYVIDETNIPLDKIEKDELVWIVDFHISPEKMIELHNITENIIWVDHHISSIEEFKDFDDFEIKGIRISDMLAGCELTWIYLMMMLNGESCMGSPEKDLREYSWFEKMPQHVQLVGDMDVWRWDFGDATKFVTTGLSASDVEPTSEIWRKCFDKDFLSELFDQGKIIEKYKETWAQNYTEQNAFETEFQGHKTLACNVGKVGSMFFGDKQDEYDVLLTFLIDSENMCHVSIYSPNEKIDMSKLATKYGGGGHKGASGFMTDATEFLKEIIPTKET